MDQKRPATEQSIRQPLVATLAITPSAQLYFNKLRQQHFPPERNYLDAHLTLFHALPDEPWIIEDLKELVKDYKPFEATAQSITSLGNGTAVKIKSVELPVLHLRLQQKWFNFLTSQDRQKRSFHITIQNKVEPQEAKKLKLDMEKNFNPFDFTIQGIQLWRYLGGPWEFKSRFDFSSNATELLNPF